jgi:hypothetical protein
MPASQQKPKKEKGVRNSSRRCGKAAKKNPQQSTTTGKSILGYSKERFYRMVGAVDAKGNPSTEALSHPNGFDGYVEMKKNQMRERRDMTRGRNAEARARNWANGPGRWRSEEQAAKGQAGSKSKLTTHGPTGPATDGKPASRVPSARKPADATARKAIAQITEAAYEHQLQAALAFSQGSPLILGGE